MARKGLGKGLDTGILGGEGLAALLGDDDGAESVRKLKITDVEPRIGQPRTVFDPVSLDELADSIREHGVLQPITVRRNSAGYYEIIAGERRWRAARLAELTEIPAIVIEADDKKAAELAMVENLQREDLSPIEEARGYQSLMEACGYTQEAAAKRVGKSRPVVANALRLLRLPKDVQELMERRELPLSHARLLLELKNPADASFAAKYIVKNSLSVKKTEQLIRRMNAGQTPPEERSRAHEDGVDYYGEVEKELTKRLGRRVRITAGAKNGRFEIDYYGKEDFELVYEALLRLKTGGGAV